MYARNCHNSRTSATFTIRTKTGKALDKVVDLSVNDDTAQNVYFDFSKNFLPAGDYVLTVKVKWQSVDVKDYTVAIHTGKDQITITDSTGKTSNA